MNRWHSFWQYLGECLRLLYWAFCKPITFNHWLQQEVHPDLKFDDNPFQYRHEFTQNLALQRYADQVLWLNLVMPWLLTLLVAIPYTLINGNEFLWSKSTLVLCVWNFGVLLIKIIPEKILHWIFNIVSVVAIILALFLLFVLLSKFLNGQLVDLASNSDESVSSTIAYPLVAGMMLSIVRGTGLGVVLGVAIGVMGGMVLSMMGGVALGIAFGMAFGATGGMTGIVLKAGGMMTGFAPKLLMVFSVVEVILGALLGLVFGLMADMTSGWTVGLSLGVAFGVSYLLGLFRLPFWIFELVWMLVLRLNYTPVQANQALRWLPPRFDEVIYLPLPFITELITEAYRSNHFVARQSIDYLINFTNQQAVVRGVFLNLFLRLLQSCKTEYDVAYLVDDELESNIWIIPKTVGGDLLPQYLDISRNVRSAFDATNAYRHKELLAKPINELTQIRQQLAYEKNTLISTSLGQITQSWLAILETAQNVLLEQIKQSGELPAGAYVAGNALDPELADANFRGRLVIFAEIENLMLATQPPILLLYGGRRTGKTSALKQLPKRMGTDFVPLLVDMQGVAEASTLLGVAEGIAKQMQESARSSRNMILPSYDIQALQCDPFPALRDWFKAIEKKFPNKRFLLCMDEFERLEEVVTATQSRAPLNFLRSTYQHHNRWLILFSGSHHPDELADYWSDYLINTRTLSVSYLQEDEARDLIEHPNNDFPAQVYDSLAIDEIVRQTHCQPYLVQLLCQNVIERINQDKRRQVVKDDVTAAMPRAIERGQQYFAELWNETLKNSCDRDVIKKLLANETLTEEEKQRAPYLLDKNILETTDSTYRFQVPIVEEFLRGKLAR